MVESRVDVWVNVFCADLFDKSDPIELMTETLAVVFATQVHCPNNGLDQKSRKLSHSDARS
jgi:hypothetical protein